MAKYDNREDQRISLTHCTVTSDAPWSFLSHKFEENLGYNIWGNLCSVVEIVQGRRVPKEWEWGRHPERPDMFITF